MKDIFLPFVEQGHIQVIAIHLRVVSQLTPTSVNRRNNRKPFLQVDRCLAQSLSVGLDPPGNPHPIKYRNNSVFVLERLTDENIREIVISALERIPVTHIEEPLDPIDSPLESSPSTSSQILVLSQVSSSDIPSFPAFPQLTPQILSSLVSLSTGDARTALSLLELVLTSPKNIKESNLLSSLRRSVSASYDRTGESHYDMISALHKSVRGSQGSAAMYWLARMLTAGEDPMYIARRMVVCASEDIGLADRHALPLVATFRLLVSPANE